MKTNNRDIKANYESAFNAIYPSYRVEVRGPNKKGICKVLLNDDDGGMKLSEGDIIEATAQLSNQGKSSLSACMKGNRYRLESIAKMV
jgi:hypothetical protein